jgi:hypothetical protein
MRAQGTVDGQNWVDLGQLMPVTVPTPGAAPNTIILGAASFFWQDPPSRPAMQAIHVISGTQTSSAVSLSGLPIPPTHGGPNAVPIDSIAVTPIAAGGTAMPRANGVDQAAMVVQLIPRSGGGLISPDDPRYQLIYYRDAASGSLITGLYTPGEYADYVAVGPWRGAYPEDASQARRGALHRLGSGRTRSYLVTNSGDTQRLSGMLNDSGTANAYTSSDIPVTAQTTPLTASGTAVGGIQVARCAAACPLAVPTPTPALYQAGNSTVGPMIGLQLAVTAVTGTSSLPLAMTAGNVHNLASGALTVTPAEARLANASSFWPNDTIDTTLVTSGESVAAHSIPVGGQQVGRRR